MKPNKVIVFDIWGQYAHFKKIYVTTSALSYGVPFKTSIYGLVGAILGLDNRKNDYLNHFNESNCRIGIQIINPIKLQRLSINLSDKPGPIGKNRKPTMMEYIRNPHYRIFFWHSNEDLNKKLIIYLGTKTSVYTPVLGLAHCLTNFGFKGIAEINSEEDDAIIQTVIPKSKLIEFDYKYLLDNEIYLQEQSMYPLEMNTQREVTKRDSILFDLNGKSMKAKTNEYFQAIFNNQQIAIMLM